MHQLANFPTYPAQFTQRALIFFFFYYNNHVHIMRNGPAAVRSHLLVNVAFHFTSAYRSVRSSEISVSREGREKISFGRCYSHITHNMLGKKLCSHGILLQVNYIFCQHNKCQQIFSIRPPIACANFLYANCTQYTFDRLQNDCLICSSCENHFHFRL